MLPLRYKITITLLFLASVLAICYFSYRQGLWRFNYPAPEQYPVQGLDVSHHQGRIEWHKIPKERYKFVYIKATEGGDHRDKNFPNNWREALQLFGKFLSR